MDWLDLAAKETDSSNQDSTAELSSWRRQVAGREKRHNTGQRRGIEYIGVNRYGVERNKKRRWKMRMEIEERCEGEENRREEKEEEGDNDDDDDDDDEDEDEEEEEEEKAKEEEEREEEEVRMMQTDRQDRNTVLRLQLLLQTLNAYAWRRPVVGVVWHASYNPITVHIV
ncbi:uncharacterized protein BDCG_07380 [Blastomyces dermatitidis ER-3]|uniref:Uncharacterized protein n=1 Tax=Ajellomyces dermatitidis (strain ER-3 / ATCC MYA-2586) TaxID=559297 RepID=A0ABP2F5D7_AJEDR|nr:uncharacterized protein BDCG_07380 [Blastomyces dermatitidis ER-3]EEQ92260.2 hypothetical protein BDCG_07380 [Blastomyces dermatitidis ER-3]